MLNRIYNITENLFLRFIMQAIVLNSFCVIMTGSLFIKEPE